MTKIHKPLFAWLWLGLVIASSLLRAPRSIAEDGNLPPAPGLHRQTRRAFATGSVFANATQTDIDAAKKIVEKAHEEMI